MALKYNIDDKTRFIVLYQDVTKEPTRITKLLKLPLTTIYNWIRSITNGKDIFAVEPGRGRRRTISEGTKRNIARSVSRDPHKSSSRKLAAIYNVSHKSVQEILKAKDFSYKSTERSKPLTDQVKEDRVAYCRNMLKRKAAPIHQTFFSDETGITLKDLYQKKVWTQGIKRVKVNPPQKDVKLNCWGAISSNGATPLYIFKDNLDTKTYREILDTHKEIMDKLYPNGYRLQHDNHRAHTAAEPWGESQGIEFVDYPSYSPDLNPIENVWATLKYAVASDNPKTERQLRNSLLQNWEETTSVEALAPYFEGLEKKYRKCIDLNGEFVTK